MNFCQIEQAADNEINLAAAACFRLTAEKQMAAKVGAKNAHHSELAPKMKKETLAVADEETQDDRVSAAHCVCVAVGTFASHA